MKNEKRSAIAISIKLVMMFTAVAGIMMVSYACGNTKPKEPATSELAPPPPPPPPVPKEDKVLTTVDEMPQFKGGDAGIRDYISHNVAYPDEAKKKNITGKVLVKFVVEKDGSISNAEIEKGVNPLLDAEALRVVSSLPKFEKPGKHAGELVRVRYMLPISFALN